MMDNALMYSVKACDSKGWKGFCGVTMNPATSCTVFRSRLGQELVKPFRPRLGQEMAKPLSKDKSIQEHRAGCNR